MILQAMVAVFSFFFSPALAFVGSCIFWPAVAVSSSFFWLLVSVCNSFFWPVAAVWSYVIGPVVTMEAPGAAGMFVSRQAFEACPALYHSLLRRFGSGVAVPVFGGHIPGSLIRAVCSIPAAARRLLQRSADGFDGAALWELVKAKADELFPPETRWETLGRWLHVAVNKALPASLGALALFYFFRGCWRTGRGLGNVRIRNVFPCCFVTKT